MLFSYVYCDVYGDHRDLPVRPQDLPTQRAADHLVGRVKPPEPVHQQFCVGQGTGITDHDHFERKLFVVRKRIFNTLYAEGSKIPRGLYIPSFSSRTIVYKGMLLAAQVGPYYKDLQDPRMVTALALVHQDRKSVVSGKRASVRVDLGGCRIIKYKK